MKILFLVTIITFFGCLVCSPNGSRDVNGLANQEADHQKVIEPGLISPGRGIDHVQLLDAREKVIARLGEPLEEHVYDYESSEGSHQSCNRAELRWLARDKGDGLSIFVRDGAVYQINISDADYRTNEGISIEADISDVLSKYPNRLRPMKLTKSAADYNGGNDLLYLVDEKNGIAFEMYFHRKDRTRRLWTTVIFLPNSQFVPVGCIPWPRSLQELNDLDDFLKGDTQES